MNDFFKRSGGVWAMKPEELHEAAKQVAKREDRHWSRVAAILGRVERERLYKTLGPGYSTTIAYAINELDLSVQESSDLLKLHKMMEEGNVPPSEWATIPRAHAHLIRRVMLLGGDARTWIANSRAAGSEAKLRQMVDQVLGKDPWTKFEYAVPLDLKESIIDGAMLKALVGVTRNPDVDPLLVVDRGYRAQCLELIFGHFMQTWQPEPGD